MAACLMSLGFFALVGIVAATPRERPRRDCEHLQIERDDIGDLRCAGCGLDLCD